MTNKMTLAEYAALYCRPELLTDWDRDKNAPLTPEDITYGSKQSLWWRCAKGHAWQASAKARSAGTGCPVCAGHRLAPGVNDLKTRFPFLAAQWHPEKNGSLTPEQFLPGSHQKVWWQCEKGHEWQASITARASGGTDCPVCTGKKVLAGVNDLESLFPNLAAQWDREKNALSPRQVTPGSNRAVWWRCALGHSWRAPVGRRVQFSTGCPYCAGRKVLPGFNDLATREPLLAAQWDPDRNAPLTPQQVTCGSGKRVWWRCEEGHVWRAIIYSRAGQSRAGCPVCAGVARQTYPQRYQTAPKQPQKSPAKQP